jgi:hypothetical protein
MSSARCYSACPWSFICYLMNLNETASSNMAFLEKLTGIQPSRKSATGSYYEWSPSLHATLLKGHSNILPSAPISSELLVPWGFPTNIQADWKVTTNSWHMFCWKNNKLRWNQKTKKQYFLSCWKCPPCSATHAFTIFLMFDATRWKVPVVTGNGSPDEILSICLAQENRECSPKLILAS